MQVQGFTELLWLATNVVLGGLFVLFLTFPSSLLLLFIAIVVFLL